MLRLAAVIVGIVGLLIVLLVWFRAGGTWGSGGVNAQFAAQIPALRAKYMNAEGDANRGPKFAELAMALNHKQMSGAPPTEAEMVQTLGPPDLMFRGPAGQAEFAYFYDRFGKKDWVVYFWYGASGLTIGWNGASANPQTHAQMVPYAPPGTAAGPTTSASETPRQIRGHDDEHRREQEEADHYAGQAEDEVPVEPHGAGGFGRGEQPLDGAEHEEAVDADEHEADRARLRPAASVARSEPLGLLQAGRAAG